MEQTAFTQLSLILALAAVVSLVLHRLRQPLIIGYILTGIIAGPALLNIVHDHEALKSFSELGIALLLFIIGLGLNVATIRATGKPVLVAFMAVVLGLGVTGFGVSRLLGLSSLEAIVITVALLFSSTIIVIAALSDKKEQSRLYGQIAIGILLVEDIMATLALVFIAASGPDGLSAGQSLSSSLLTLLLKGVFLAAGLTIAGLYLLPRITRLLARSSDLLFLFALAWAFGISSVFYWYGFSLEVGALFAGVAMAHLPYATGVASRLKPLRDFFIVLFFVELGQTLPVQSLGKAVVPALILSLLVLLVKPLVIMASLGWLGYTKQTVFKTAIHLSQISEFSLIFVVLAVNKHLVGPELSSIIAVTAIITILVSAYLMKFDDSLFNRLQSFLTIFERRETRREVKSLEAYPLVLLGYRGGGHEFIRSFRQLKGRFIVIDYDPEVAEELEAHHINHLYGDVTDLELLEEISLHDSELVVSTINDVATNLLLVQHIMGHVQKGADKPTIFVCHAASLDDAVTLYENGASYVLLPHFIGSERAGQFIRRNGSDYKAFEKYRNRHLKHLHSSRPR